MTNVSKLSSISSSALVGIKRANVWEKEIKQLNEQKARLQDELHKVQANADMDSKMKMERVKNLTSNIQQIDTRISEIKVEQLQKNQENRPQETKSAQSKEMDPHLVALVEKSAAYDQLGKIAGTKKKLEGENRTVQGELKFDRTLLEANPSDDLGKTLMTENAESTVFQSKREQMQDLQEHIRTSDKRMRELLTDIRESENIEKPKESAVGAFPSSDESENRFAEKADSSTSSVSPERSGSSAINILA